MFIEVKIYTIKAKLIADVALSSGTFELRVNDGCVCALIIQIKNFKTYSG